MNYLGESKITKEEAFKLFDEGLKPKDLIEKELSPPSTAHTWYSEWRQKKEHVKMMNDAEIISFLFKMFKNGIDTVDVIIEAGAYGISDEKALEAKETYDKVASMVTISLQDYKNMRDEILDSRKQIPILRNAIQVLRTDSVEMKNMQDKLNSQLTEAVKNFKELLTEQWLLLFRALDQLECHSCGKATVQICLRCQICGQTYLYPSRLKVRFPM